MNDVAYQDEVVAVLKKSVLGADVRACVREGAASVMLLCSGAKPAVLWTPWHWQDLSHSCYVQGTVWRGDDEGTGAGAECFRRERDSGGEG